MAYEFGAMSANSSTPTPARSSLPNLNKLRKQILNRMPENEATIDTPPLMPLPFTPRLLLSSTQTSITQIPVTPPSPPALAPPTLGSPPSSMHRASSPAAKINSEENPVDCLQGVVACIDIRTEDGSDVSANFIEDLRNMGAQTRKTFAGTVTHLIYKNGAPSNIRKALKKKNCKIVNLLWVTNCKLHGKHLPEDKYLISNPESLILSATKRPKCMVPGKVKELRLDNSSENSEHSKSGKRSLFAASPTHHSTFKRPKLHIAQPSDSLNTNDKRQDTPPHRKPSVIISKETTSSRHSKSIKDTTTPVVIDLESNNLQQQIYQHRMGSEGEARVSKGDRPTLLPRSRRKINTNDKHNILDHPSSPIPQRPQINQDIKAGFYIQPSSSASKPSYDLQLSPVLLHRVSKAMTISEDSMKSPIAIRRRHRPLPKQITPVPFPSLIPAANKFTSLPPNSPTPTTMPPTITTTCDGKTANSPSAFNYTYSLRPNRNGPPTIVLTSMATKQKRICASAIKALGKYRLASTVDEKTTHVIVTCQRRTQSVVLGLVHGAWIVTPDWLLDSYNSGEYLNEAAYEATQFFPRAKAARCRDPLLPSTISIYMHDCSLPETLVNELVINGGGHLAAHSHDADIVISNTPLDCTALVVIEDWLLDSIEKWRYLATSVYAPVSK